MTAVNVSTNMDSLSPTQHTSVDNTKAEGIRVYCSLTIHIFGVLGNSLVLYVIGYKKQARRNESDMLYGLLALLDIISSLILPVLSGLRFFHYISEQVTLRSICITVEVVTSLNVCVTEAILILIGVERYRGIHLPFRSKLGRRTIAMSIVGAVCISMAILTPFWVDTGVFCKTRKELKEIHLKPNDVLEMLISPCLSATRDVGVVLILAILTFQMVRKLKRKQTEFPDQVNSVREKRFLRARKLLLVVFLLFVVCVLPKSLFSVVVHVLIFANSFNVGGEERAIAIEVLKFLQVLEILNFAVNPLIYSFMHPRFVSLRRKIKHRCKKYHSENREVRPPGAFVLPYKSTPV